MKKIINKTVKVEVPTVDGKTTIERKYSELITECVNNPPKEGFSVSEMQHRMRILKEAEKANGELRLEDADFEKLRECVKAMRWKFMSPDIIAFCESIILMK